MKKKVHFLGSENRPVVVASHNYCSEETQCIAGDQFPSGVPAHIALYEPC
jgi:hypothetical protein